MQGVTPDLGSSLGPPAHREPLRVGVRLTASLSFPLVGTSPFPARRGPLVMLCLLSVLFSSILFALCSSSWSLTVSDAGQV